MVPSVAINTSLAPPGALIDCLQCRTNCKIKNGLVWKGVNLWIFGTPVNYCKKNYFAKLTGAPKNLGVDTLPNPAAIWSPLAAILDFTVGAALQALGKFHRRR